MLRAPPARDAPRRSLRDVLAGDSAEQPPPDVRQRLRAVLLKSELARCKDDYEFLDRYVHTVTYFADLPPRERLRYLRIVKGVELERGEELFHIGDPADAFYCIMYGSLNVVVDFSHAAVPSMNGFDEILNRARIQSTFLNPGGATDDQQGMTYVVRFMKALECFGDVGLLTSDQQRTASVVANEKTLCMKIEREAFLELRKSYSDRELREKIKFLASIPAFEHWDADNILRLTGRMEKVSHSYNDVIVKEGDLANHFYFVKHGECRLVKEFPTLRIDKQRCFVELCSINSRHYVGGFEVITGAAEAQFSVLVSSPSAVLYRMDRVDFRHTVLKDTTTERMIRSECVELANRINVDNVRQDLERDVRWSQYKRELVTGILERHQREHASPLHGQRSPRTLKAIKTRPPEITTVPLIKTNCSALPASAQGRPGRMLVDPQRPMQQPGSRKSVRRPSRWLDWAKQRAHDIVNEAELSVHQAEEDGELASNIQWGAAAKVMGGLDDEAKITSAIESLFNPKDVRKR